MKKIIFFLILFWLGLVCAPFGCNALTVSPAKIEFSADPGDTLNGTIALISTENKEVTYYPTFERVETTGSFGEPVFTGEKNDLASWIKTNDNQIVLQPKQQAVANFTIKVPKDAAAGGHYAAIFWGTTPPDGNGGNVSIASRTAILILLNVSGDVKVSGEILNFGTKKVVSYLPIQFSYSFKNTGTVFLKPSGELQIKNIFGKTVVVLPLDQKGYNVLPNSERDFEVAWANKSTIEGKGFFINLKREAKDFFKLGYYKANLNLSFGAKPEIIKAKFSFFIFPWRLLSIIIALAIILFFGFVIGGKKYNQWVINKVKEQMEKAEQLKKLEQQEIAPVLAPKKESSQKSKTDIRSVSFRNKPVKKPSAKTRKIRDI